MIASFVIKSLQRILRNDLIQVTKNNLKYGLTNTLLYSFMILYYNSNFSIIIIIMLLYYSLHFFKTLLSTLPQENNIFNIIVIATICFAQLKAKM